MSTPQLILSLNPDGSLSCEAPSLNGVRNKIECKLTLHDLSSEMVANLLDQRDRINLRIRHEKQVSDRERARVAKRVFQTAVDRKYADLLPNLAAKLNPDGKAFIWREVNLDNLE